MKQEHGESSTTVIVVDLPAMDLKKFVRIQNSLTNNVLRLLTQWQFPMPVTAGQDLGSSSIQPILHSPDMHYTSTEARL